MIYVQHRVNQISQLKNVNPAYGCEIDLRSQVNHAQDLHLSHDPFTLGDSFAHWLEVYAKLNFQGPLILNTKEDGLENTALELLKAHSIKNFFFLDTTLPTLVRRTHQNQERHFAVRLSQFEPISITQLFTSKAEWIWLDCFFGQIPDFQSLASLTRDFKICLVSPELQTGQVNTIQNFAKQITPAITAICTKRPDLWQRALVC